MHARCCGAPGAARRRLIPPSILFPCSSEHDSVLRRRHVICRRDSLLNTPAVTLRADRFSISVASPTSSVRPRCEPMVSNSSKRYRPRRRLVESNTCRSRAAVSPMYLVMSRRAAPAAARARVRPPALTRSSSCRSPAVQPGGACSREQDPARRCARHGAARGSHALSAARRDCSGSFHGTQKAPLPRHPKGPLTVHGS